MFECQTMVLILQIHRVYFHIRPKPFVERIFHPRISDWVTVIGGNFLSSTQSWICQFGTISVTAVSFFDTAVICDCRRIVQLSVFNITLFLKTEQILLLAGNNLCETE